MTARVNLAPSVCSLASDLILLSHGITLEIGRIKNPNTNPVVQCAIEELSLQLINQSPEWRPVSNNTLALAKANTNSRIPQTRLIAREVWTQRYQLTGQHLPVVDRQLIRSQNFSRQQNHLPSAAVSADDLIFLTGDQDKLKAREKYLMVSISERLSCKLWKFATSHQVYLVPTTIQWRQQFWLSIQRV